MNPLLKYIMIKANIMRQEPEYTFEAAFNTALGPVDQYFDFSDDATFFIIVDQVEELSRYEAAYTVSKEANLYDKTGRCIGRFTMFGANDWSYSGNDGCCAYNLGPDLLKAERLIVERLIAMEVQGK